MSVTLREKSISGGKVSLYLDIYHNKARWPEFLNIHINKKRPTDEDKEKRRLANEIRAKREHELIVLDNGLTDKKKRQADFIQWFEKIYIPSKNWCTRFSSTLYNLKVFRGAKVERTYILVNGKKRRKDVISAYRPLPFSHMTPRWCVEFKNFLLGRVSSNTAYDYIMTLFTAMEKAEKQDIIDRNPFRKVDEDEWIQRTEADRQPHTIGQIQMLADTPCDIHPQIKQAFFFDNFAGLRWGDLNSIEWTKILVKGENWYMATKQGKTGKFIYVPLSDQAIDILKERKREKEETGCTSPYVFPAIKEVDGTKNRYMWFRYALKKWGKAARAKWGEDCGITDKSMRPHEMRHSFATNTLEASDQGDLLTVSKLLGHTKIKSTQIYAHIREARKLEAVKALPKIKLQVVHKAA